MGIKPVKNIKLKTVFTLLPIYLPFEDLGHVASVWGRYYVVEHYTYSRSFRDSGDYNKYINKRLHFTTKQAAQEYINAHRKAL